VLAVQAVDLQLGRLLPLFRQLNGALIVTADHGNADEMFEKDTKSKEILLDEEGKPRAKTSHTLNPVPCMIYAPNLDLQMDSSLVAPGLSNLAATVLQLLGHAAPDDYDPGLLTL